ncbi:BTAD domain-containing putative transcriptional regulator [Leifsonia sp. 22587]|uniref:BTAD domain-containing putative transcriptional regulator n=1 Tax=Leifsonia sp. 22587 TaxID=3453946 RepID=UPI003F829A4F
MIEVRLLGPTRVVVDGVEVDAGPPKQRALLALLTLNSGRTVSVDQLMATLWEDDPPASAISSIHAYISNLRRVLRGPSGAPTIVRQGSGYSLVPNAADIDVTAFRDDLASARRAANVGDWRMAADTSGRALERFHDRALVDLAGDFSELDEFARALEEERLDALELRAESLIRSNAPETALPLLARASAARPLAEDPVRLRMIAFHALGRTADASTAFHEHAERLATELGLDPSPTVRELHTQLLRGTSPLGTRSAPPAEDPEESRLHDDVVGRVAQRQQLLTAVEDAYSGTPRWCILTGPAGIGKTTLAEWALAEFAAKGADDIRIRCQQDDAAPSWWVVQRLLSALGHDPDVVLDARGSDADAAAHLLLERTHQAVGATLKSSGRRVGVLIDDAQWADANSLRALLYVADNLRDASFLVTLTVRDGTTSPDTDKLLARFAHNRTARQLRVPPLRSEEVSTLVESLTDELITPERAAELTELTQGSPFLLQEYTRLSSEDRANTNWQEAAASVLSRRLAIVDPEVVSVLRSAAVAGEPIDLEMLAELTTLHTDSVADLIDEAADQGFIVATRSGQYRFAHALIREHLLSGLSPLRRQRLHLAAANWIDRSGNRGTRALFRRATHYLAAFPLASAPIVLESAIDAARSAEGEYDTERAAEWWGTALSFHRETGTDAAPIERRDELRIAYVEALARAGRGQTVLDAVDTGILEAIRERRSSSAGVIAAALVRTAGCWPWVSYRGDPSGLLGRLAGIEPLVQDDAAAHARVLAALAVGSYYEDDPAVPDELSRRAIELAEQSGDPDALADALLGRVLAFVSTHSHLGEALEIIQRINQLPHARAAFDEALTTAILVATHLGLGDPAAARETLRQAIVRADLLRLPVIRVQLRWVEGMLAQWDGDVSAAERHFELAYELHRETELYTEGVRSISAFALRYAQGLKHDLPVFAHQDQLVGLWSRTIAAAEADERSLAQVLIRELIGRSVPLQWTSVASLVIAGDAAARLQLEDELNELTGLLEPFQNCVANIGQVGVLGTVAECLARMAEAAGQRSESFALIDAAIRAR